MHFPYGHQQHPASLGMEKSSPHCFCPGCSRSRGQNCTFGYPHVAKSGLERHVGRAPEELCVTVSPTRS